LGLNRVVRGEMLGMTRMGHSGARYAGSTIYRGDIVQGGGEGRRGEGRVRVRGGEGRGGGGGGRHGVGWDGMG
jgi:hypothetical protein